MLSKQEIKFIVYLLSKQKGITKNDRIDISLPAFYMMVWRLRDKGIIKSTRTDDRNRKVWELTQNGIRIAHKLKEIEEIMNE